MLIASSVQRSLQVPSKGVLGDGMELMALAVGEDYGQHPLHLTWSNDDFFAAKDPPPET
jgi:hypothetical protein